MGRLRRNSRVIEQARTRHMGLKSGDSNFDLGNSLTAVTFAARISAAQTALDTYNDALATSDRLLNDLLAEERALKEFSGRILAAVKAKYGPDSNEYENAGGTRLSERQSPTRKPAPTKT